MKCSDCAKSAVCKWNAALEAIFTPKDDTTGFPFKDSGRGGDWFMGYTYDDVDGIADLCEHFKQRISEEQ